MRKGDLTLNSYNLIRGLLSDGKVTVFFHAVDKRLEAYLRNWPSTEWLSKAINSQRLILADARGCPPTWTAVAQWIDAIRKQFPDRKIVLLIDNVGRYQ